MLPCDDESCAYETTIIESYNDCYKERCYCTKKKCYQEEINECIDFECPQTCDNCKYSYNITYDGMDEYSIDCIDYYCKLLNNNKMIYSDVEPFTIHYADIPKCPINKFENF